MKIDILVGSNLYGSTASFAKSLFQAFIEKGVEARLFWIDDGCFYQAFYEIVADPPDLTCSFSDIRKEGLPLADLWKIPHLSLFLDPAIYFLHHLKSPFSLVSCVDEEDVSFVQSFGFSNVFFLPHAADRKHLTSPEKKRPYEKVFFGSCVDILQIEKEWVKKYPKKEVEQIYSACEEVLSSRGSSTLKALSNLGVGEKQLPLLHYEVDLYTRGKDRIELLKNHEVEIWGEGPWEKYCPHAKTHPSVPFETCLELMKQAKCVFNSSVRFKNGSHERIFYALMCGACPVTLENSFIKKHFGKDELITYQTGDWEIKQELSFWQAYAAKGQNRVLARHTWEERADLILNEMKRKMSGNSSKKMTGQAGETKIFT